MKTMLMRNQIQSELGNLENAGKSLLASKLDTSNPLNSFLSLGLALFEGFNLFSMLFSQSPEKIHILFSAGGWESADIYVRMKFIRDLCSASEYNIKRLTKPTQLDREEALGISIERIDWIEIIKEHANPQPSQENTYDEVGLLLNDTLEALLAIAMFLRDLPSAEILPPVWDEVARHVDHIRDHFDYAEIKLLDILRPRTD